MAIVTIADLVAEMPGLTVDNTTSPSTTQVQGYLDAVTAEVTGRVRALGVPWPADSTTEATYLRTTIIDGALARTLGAMFALSAADRTPGSVERLERKYRQELGDISLIARGIVATAPKNEGSSAPQVMRASSDPHDWQDLEDFTRRRDPTVWPGRPWGPRYGPGGRPWGAPWP